MSVCASSSGIRFAVWRLTHALITFLAASGSAA